MITVDDEFLLRPVNAYTYCDPNTFKNIETVKVSVTKGDNGKNYSYAYKPAYKAYLEAAKQLAKVNIFAVLMSCARDAEDQIYATNEVFIINLKRTGDPAKAKQLTLETTSKVGYSEHHTGLAFDISAPTANANLPEDYKTHYGNSAGFEYKRKILESNGFILTYPIDDRLEEVTGMKTNETWHWRYIGKEHSTKIRSIRKEVAKRLGKRHEVFLEDYWSLITKYGLTYFDPTADFADLFITEILGQDLNDNLNK